jgi:uncharacterized protein (DUF1778 family)
MARTKPETITLRIGPQLRDAIGRYAAAREMTPSEFMRHALRAYMASTAEQESNQ